MIDLVGQQFSNKKLFLKSYLKVIVVGIIQAILSFSMYLNSYSFE